jgi:hypothetical protein
LETSHCRTRKAKCELQPSSALKQRIYETIGLPKLLCGKALMQFANPISHKRTVLSVDADNKCCKVSIFNGHEQKGIRETKNSSISLMKI